MRQLYIISLIFWAILISASYCKRDESISACGIEDPIKNVKWLQSIIDYYNNDTSQTWDTVNIYLYDYNNSNAFALETKKTGVYDIPMSIYNCEGKPIFICGGLQPPQLDSCNVFFKSASNKILLWSKINYK